MTEKQQMEYAIFHEFYDVLKASEYWDLSEEEFKREMEELHQVRRLGIEFMEQSNLYKGLVRLREIGSDEYKKELDTKFELFNSEELQELVNSYNYDSDKEFLLRIVNSEKCSISTVQQIYWALQPDYFYGTHPSLEACASDESMDHTLETIMILKHIEELVSTKVFAPEVDNHMIYDVASISGNDHYSNEPYKYIPEPLRV